MLGLNTLRQKLNGNAADSPTLEAQLAEIQIAIDALPGRQAELAERRLVALRRDDDAEARGIEAQQADLARDRDRLDDSKRNIGEQLRDATAAARQRRLLSHREAWSVAAAEFLASARVTAAKHAAVVAVRELACRQGFENEATLMMPATPNINGNALCAPPLLDLYALAVAGQSSATRIPTPPPLPTSASRKRALLPHQRARITDSARTVTLDDAAPGIHRAERTPDDQAPLEPGQARVRVLRAGYSPANDRPQAHYGQLLRMSLQVALRAEGVVEIVERYGDPAPNSAAPEVPEARA
jgi:hypothetical protein